MTDKNIENKAEQEKYEKLDKQLRVAEFEVNGETVMLNMATVRNYLTRGDVAVTDAEVGLFINMCRYQKLNPFLNEVYLIKYSTKKPAEMVVGVSAFEKRAEHMPAYNGYKSGIIVQRGKEILEFEGAFKLPTDKLLGGWAIAYRADRPHPTIARVNLAEYNTGKSSWQKMPCTMIRKVAKAQVLREMYPSESGGMYAEEEMGEMDSANIAQKQIDTEANGEIIDVAPTAEVGVDMGVGSDQTVATVYTADGEIDEAAVNHLLKQAGITPTEIDEGFACYMSMLEPEVIEAEIIEPAPEKNKQKKIGPDF